MHWKAFILVAAMAAQSALGDGLPELGESSQGDLSPQMERKIGESAMRDIRQRESAYLDDPEITEYLNSLGTKLAAGLPDRQQDFEFFALRDPTLNAFAMPGGYIGVHTGLLLAAQSESELAGVLGHEIAHVTQHHIARLVGQQKQAGLMSLAALAVAILAARSNTDASQAALATGTAVGIQNQLNFTRDFEREADRIGIQSLQGAGFDARAMAAFFVRLQQFGRLYENNAPAYLRTHPLTTERIADMENRAASYPRRQVADSLGFQLVRAKVRSQQGAPADAVTDFEALLQQRKPFSEGAARYGLARAYLRANKPAAAQREVEALRGLRLASPMVETLAAEVSVAGNDAPSAVKSLRQARQRYPQNKALAYALAATLLDSGQAQEAQRRVADDLRTYPGDGRLWALQARSYAALGKRALEHRSQAEVYALQGQYAAAVEQLEIAQKSGDGDFYVLSAVDSRLRELRARQAEEAKQKKQP